ncbi:MAG: hypothetical protein G01um101416_950 [Microgenomates group bacterium Gr01-1014_16]|nr:MAG: hypothetical protein G01um101416_950 [Microgenomates group bacterium Gr01-1014_16]
MVEEASLAAEAVGSATKVPVLGFGMRPFGPKSLANLSNLGMSSGVARRMSKSIFPDSIWAITLSETMAIFLDLPVEWGRSTETWLLGATLRLI